VAVETPFDVCELYTEEDAELLYRDREPEAWSVTVDMKTLKRMNSKDIKRQDHIWGQSVTNYIPCRKKRAIFISTRNSA